MKKNLGPIKRKLDHIQAGLLRFRDNDEQVTLQVNAKSNLDDSINCIITGDVDLNKLPVKLVNLVQKSENDYIYISGEIHQTPGNHKMISFKVIRGCWFVRKSKGTMTWLQEKYIYNKLADVELELAS
ncbi:MAG: hypothetical protein ACSLE0_16945 [Chitinophagaceae bacterium]